MAKGYNGMFRQNKKLTKTEKKMNQMKSDSQDVFRTITLMRQSLESLERLVLPLCSLLKDKDVFKEEELNWYIKALEEQKRELNHQQWNAQFGYRDATEKEVVGEIDPVSIRYSIVDVKEDGTDGFSTSHDDVVILANKPLYLQELGDWLIGKKIGDTFDLQGECLENKALSRLVGKRVKMVGCILRIKKKLIKEELKNDETK